MTEEELKEKHDKVCVVLEIYDAEQKPKV